MLQCPVDRYVASREVRADFEQDIARIDNGLPGSIDVNETRVRVNEIQADVEPIERIGECGGFRGHSGIGGMAFIEALQQAEAAGDLRSGGI